jgi:hypothetical protein
MSDTRDAIRAKGEPCPGCGRQRAECWSLPCLYLEQLKEQGMEAVEQWAAAGGGIVVPRESTGPTH